MTRFECDYGEGAAPAVLELLARTNAEKTPGYGEDVYCAAAADRVRALCAAPRAAVHFFVGATQANLTVIDALLRPWQGVLCAESGHINVHETGAVEATGHKCLPLPPTDGKITAEQVAAAVAAHKASASHEHEAMPAMVYVSQPTECGTLYTKAELAALSAVCRQNGLLLFLDGARMAYALACPQNGLTLPDYAALCDAFYLGGTKCGALFGEALVLPDPDLCPDFRYALKQHGGMLAKGRLLGLQFLALLGESGAGPIAQTPYYTMAARANALAGRLAAAFTARGCAELYNGCCTNQRFFTLPAAWYETLSQSFAMTVLGRSADAVTVRLCTSWATRPGAVDALCAAVAAL